MPMSQSKKIEPAFWRVTQVNINGIKGRRLMLVLRTNGCEYAKSPGGGCTMCGFKNSSCKNVSDDEMKAQLWWAIEGVLSEDKNINQLDLLTLGSFYNDREISPEFRDFAMREISRLPRIKKVVIESRAEYVTKEKLQKSKELLGDKILEFSIGLESSDDYIRNSIIKKGLSRNALENCLGLCAETGLDFMAYILIKPPYVSEKYAILDAVNSANFIFDTAKRQGVNARVSLEPVFIPENAPIEQLYFRNEYKVPNLWSVIEVVKRLAGRGCIFVGLSDENLSKDRLTGSCEKCREKLCSAIERFNETQSAEELYSLNCSCRSGWLREVVDVINM
ncbi:MAG: hypothetical protein V1676_02550 [Candidatus Diapherotrites archaeon]